MTARFTALATLLGAGVTAAAIAAAPAAFAQPACDQTNPSGAGQTGGGEVCQSPATPRSTASCPRSNRPATATAEPAGSRGTTTCSPSDRPLIGSAPGNFAGAGVAS